jgi:NSS family neurotransmitter:Na+ symporter
MIIPAVFVFMGKDGMQAGPGLMFVSLPRVFLQMGRIGGLVGCLFFAMVLFAATTSAVSILEAVVSSFMDQFHCTRKTAVLGEGAIALILGIIVCMGYDNLYFELKLPNGVVAQILDIMDYVSNNLLMPIVAIGTCILVGWILKPKFIIDEVTKNGEKFGRKGLLIVMIKFVAPILLAVLLLMAVGVI